jgi:hypothetical protein
VALAPENWRRRQAKQAEEPLVKTPRTDLVKLGAARVKRKAFLLQRGFTLWTLSGEPHDKFATPWV